MGATSVLEGTKNERFRQKKAINTKGTDGKKSEKFIEKSNHNEPDGIIFTMRDK